MKKLFLLTTILSASAGAVVQPSLSPILGTYKGDCVIKMQGNKVVDPTMLTLDRKGEAFTIKLKSDATAIDASVELVPGVAKSETIDRVETTYLLTVEDQNKRILKVTVVSKMPEYPQGLTDEYEAILNFSDAGKVKIKSKQVMAGAKVMDGSCVLAKQDKSVK